MFKRRASRVLLVSLIVTASFLYGFFSHRNKIFPYEIVKDFYGDYSQPQGRWRPVRDLMEGRKGSEKLSQLTVLPYLSGYKPAPQMKEVTVYDKKHAFNGLNFYLSGHAPEALLIDMEGNVMHKWRYDFEKVWPDYPVTQNIGRFFWRRAHLFENGDVIAMFEGLGLIKIDKDSNLLWSLKGDYHHSVSVENDGTIYTLSRKTSILPEINEEEPIQEDFITLLSPEGKVLRNISIVKCLENSIYSPMLKRVKFKSGDIFHTNELDVLSGRLADKSPYFKKGNVLISIREIDTIAIVDIEKEKVVWKVSGLWDAQHNPYLLKNGNILLFDNHPLEEKSRVIEIEPFTQRVIWMYKGDSENQFFSKTCGTCQRLPNGNTLITESDCGRAFEVTPDNEIVWEFVNPNRSGVNNELIATLFDLVRVDSDFSLSWISQDKVADKL